MEKVLTRKLLSNAKQIHSGETSLIYQMPDGDLLKVFSPLYLYILNGASIEMAPKILEADKRIHRPEIVVPKRAAISDFWQVEGYTMDKVDGVGILQQLLKMSKSGVRDLTEIANLYKKIEDVVKESPNIVFPDLCTLSNILVTRDNDIRLIDYDGLQIDNYKAVCVSSNVTGENPRGNYQLTTKNSKYFKDGFFSKNLDKKSLMYIYLYFVFGSWFSAFLENGISMEEKIYARGNVVDILGLTDEKELLEKLDTMVFSENYDNQYLEDTVFHIAENYTLERIPGFPSRVGHPTLNRLVKKR